MIKPFKFQFLSGFAMYLAKPVVYLAICHVIKFLRLFKIVSCI